GPARGERSLDGVQLVLLGETLDRRHVVPVCLRSEHQAGADEHAVEEHRTGTALALLTRVLRTRIAELLAQREKQRLALPAVGLRLDAVDTQLDPHRLASLDRSRFPAQTDARAKPARPEVGADKRRLISASSRARGA